MIYRSHRGGVVYTPENTIPAFKKALTEGYAYIETDPCYTKDGVIVLHHDGTINRTCRNKDGSEISEQIKLSDLTYDELMKYDAGIALGEEFRGTAVPRLDELLSLAEGSGVIIALDKKIPTDNMEPLFDLVEKYKVEVTFSCSDTARIKKVLARFPDAMIDYDVNLEDDALAEVVKLVRPEKLLVWLYMDKPNFSWLKNIAKASKENCERVRRYARIGVANINVPSDLREAFEFSPDVIEI